jgi:hypothetical protein
MRRMRAAWLIAIVGTVACEASTGGTAATSTLPTVVSSPSKCIEARDAVSAGPAPDGLPVQLVSGLANVIPDQDTRTAIHTYGVNKLVSSFTVCVDATGAVAHVDVKQTSCFPRYDRQVADRMATWRFAAPTGGPTACGVVPFNYDQTDQRTPDGRSM